jgi:hypothetical protein
MITRHTPRLPGFQRPSARVNYAYDLLEPERIERGHLWPAAVAAVLTAVASGSQS